MTTRRHAIFAALTAGAAALINPLKAFSFQKRGRVKLKSTEYKRNLLVPLQKGPNHYIAGYYAMKDDEAVFWKDTCINGICREFDLDTQTAFCFQVAVDEDGKHQLADHGWAQSVFGNLSIRKMPSNHEALPILPPEAFQPYAIRDAWGKRVPGIEQLEGTTGPLKLKYGVVEQSPTVDRTTHCIEGWKVVDKSIPQLSGRVSGVLRKGASA